MKMKIFEKDRLVTTLAFQGFALSLLCNLSVGLFMGGGLFLALEEEASDRSVFVAIMAMFGSVGVLMLAFFVLVSTLATKARIRILEMETPFKAVSKTTKTDTKPKMRIRIMRNDD
jgi:hypothetical protein